MKTAQLENYCDKSIERATRNAEEHIDGKRDDKATMTQCGAENTVCRALSTNITIRRHAMREQAFAMASA